MIGRLEKLKKIESILVQARNGRPSSCLVEGEPGIGKSLLLAKGKEGARSYGFQVFSAGASAFETDRPFGLLHDALSPLRGTETGPWQLATVEDPVGGDGHFLGREALIDLIERAAMTAPVLMALDDLQWADASSISVLPAILQRLRDLPIAVILAFRPLPQEEDLRKAIRSLLGMGASRIDLKALEERELRDLLQGFLESAPSDELIKESLDMGGNPFLTLEIADASRRASSRRSASREIAIPETVRTALLSRMDYLSDNGVQLLRVASVLGSSFTVTELAALVGQQSTEIAPLLEEALKCGVLLSKPDRMEFRHDLIREGV